MDELNTHIEITDELRSDLADIYEKVYPDDKRVRNGTKEEIRKAWREADQNLNRDDYTAAWVAAAAVLCGWDQDVFAAFAMDKYDGSRESYRNEYLKRKEQLCQTQL